MRDVQNVKESPRSWMRMLRWATAYETTWSMVTLRKFKSISLVEWLQSIINSCTITLRSIRPKQVQGWKGRPVCNIHGQRFIINSTRCLYILYCCCSGSDVSIYKHSLNVYILPGYPLLLKQAIASGPVSNGSHFTPTSPQSLFSSSSLRRKPHPCRPHRSAILHLIYRPMQICHLRRHSPIFAYKAMAKKKSIRPLKKEWENVEVIVDDLETDEILNKYFSSIFTLEEQ